ncbi:hypothetical protein [Streptomyces sp. NPDC005046]
MAGGFVLVCAMLSFDGLGENFSWRIAAGLQAYPLVVPAPVPSSAALGIAEWCWRRESDVEDWHRKVTDLEMARANVAATRAGRRRMSTKRASTGPAVRLGGRYETVTNCQLLLANLLKISS